MHEMTCGEWVDRWAEADYQSSWDAVLDSLAGKPAFSADDLAGVCAWKYRGLWAGTKITAMRAFDKSHPGRLAAASQGT